MKLKILTPEKIQYRGKIQSLTLKTLSGEITILDHHEPMISMFEKGMATIVDEENKKISLEVGAGFLEVTSHNELTLLTE